MVMLASGLSMYIQIRYACLCMCAPMFLCTASVAKCLRSCSSHSASVKVETSTESNLKPEPSWIGTTTMHLTVYEAVYMHAKHKGSHLLLT